MGSRGSLSGYRHIQGFSGQSKGLVSSKWLLWPVGSGSLVGGSTLMMRNGYTDWLISLVATR